MVEILWWEDFHRGKCWSHSSDDRSRWCRYACWGGWGPEKGGRAREGGFDKEKGLDLLFWLLHHVNMPGWPCLTGVLNAVAILKTVATLNWPIFLDCILSKRCRVPLGSSWRLRSITEKKNWSIWTSNQLIYRPMIINIQPPSWCINYSPFDQIVIDSWWIGKSTRGSSNQ